ncbi:MAG TPA: Asp-tRNA(Asn)/Glu-tRNA(Gln) amidotransferase subunit GatA [Candidatus Limnocylindrales bacterium]|nr:Asp-tRNA(Asn)/Glu-tRNA(Gln) amidotransferase subunit GatA [Candidatus Limnocylindrales bacterium]
MSSGGPLNELPIEEASRLLRERQISSRELTVACLARIEATDGAIGSFLEVTAEHALAQADAADARLRTGNDVTALTGIPIGLKDIFLTRGIRTTCASRILEPFVPTFDSTVVARLARAGAVLVGKLNMDEFAMGSSCENSALGRTRNPWDPQRVPGGSSGGSATSVAARQVLGSFGTDTGGSIRLPASFCGITGLKPTYGRVSRYGVIAFASSLDQVGPMAASARGTALLLEAVAGKDPLDSTSIAAPVPDYIGTMTTDLAGVRLGVPREYFIEGLDAGVEASVRAAMKRLEELGAMLVEVSLPHTEYAVATYYIVATAEASSNLGRYDGVRYGLRRGEEGGLREMYGQTRDAGFGAEVKRRIMLGTYVLSAGYYDAYYLKAMRVRTLIRADFDDAFSVCDAIVTPTAPQTAFVVGSRTDDPLKMYLSDILTISVNLAGLPGMSVPCGFDSDGMPVGMQLIGRPLDEATLLRIAAAYEGATDWHRRMPQVAE